MQRLYFIGLEQPAMTGLAIISKELGFAVSGSGKDIAPMLAQQLKRAGIHWYDRYATQHLPEDGVVVISPQLTKNNIELKQAIKQELEIVSQAQLIQQLSQNQQRLVVLGSSLAASHIHRVLQSASQTTVDYIGQQLKIDPQDSQHPKAVFFQASPQLVIEASLDQASCLDLASQALYYQPHQLVVVSPQPGYRHPVSYYKNLQHLLDDMVDVESDITTRVFIVGQDKKTTDMVIRSGLGYVTCGQQSTDDWQARKVELLDHKTVAWLYQGKKQIDMISLMQSGQQALWSALAGIAVADSHGIDTTQALLSINSHDDLHYHQQHTTINPDNCLISLLLDHRFITDLQYQLAAHRQANFKAEDQKVWLIALDQASDILANYPKAKELLPSLDVLLIGQSNQVKAKPAHLTKAASAVYCMSIEQIIRFVQQNIGHNDVLFSISSAQSNLAELTSLHRGLGIKP